MNRQDERKFVEVFVNFIKDGKADTPTDNELEYVFRKTPPMYVEGFGEYLKYKSNTTELEDPDAWDNWYDTFTYDDIDEMDIRRFSLPTKKITINFGWAEQLANGIYKCAEAFVQESEKSYNLLDNNVIVGYEFSSRGIYIYYFSPKNVELSKNSKNRGYGASRTQINELFTTYTGEAAKLISQFKGVMNSEGVFIKPNISRSESTKKVVNGKEIEIPDPDYYSGRWWCISNYDVTSNVNSTESANSFTYEFFNIINEKYESKKNKSI